MDKKQIEMAFFCDGTGAYCIPQEPEVNSDVTIRFRAAAGTIAFIALCTNIGIFSMKQAEQTEMFDYYEAVIPVGTEPVTYHFEIKSEDYFYAYDSLGLSDSIRPEYDFRILPGFHTPDWAKGAVMYQIYTDRFCNGDPSNDVVTNEYYYIDRHVHAVQNWYKAPENFDVTDFYGGDLAGVMKKLDYLERLGVEVIYFNPLFVSPSSHKYDVQDYDYIDPHFGVILEDCEEVLPPDCDKNAQATRYIRRVTSMANLRASNQLFAELVTEAHRRGIRVIIDGVFNHCGSFHKWLDREHVYEKADDFELGAYYAPDSPYHNYFRFHEENAFPKNRTYERWWGHDTLPKLNFEGSKELEERILDIGRKWVSPPYNADGWRLDVAADLGHSEQYNHKFWRKFRKAVKEANPEALILAEHYGDPSAWLEGDQWDSVMNYDAFMEPVSWFLTGMEKHSEAYRPEMLGNDQIFVSSMRYNMSHFQASSLQVSMNQLSNHDHSRFLTRTNHKVGRASNLGPAAASEDINKAVFREAIVMQMTWPGAPTLYYGDEAGLCGFTDPDNRRAYPWGREDKELLEFYRENIRIHRENPVFRDGSLKLLFSAHDVISYARFNRDQQFVIICNNSQYSRHVNVETWLADVPMDGTLTQLLYTQEDGYSTRPVTYETKGGELKMMLPQHSAVILKNTTDETKK